uniref:Putative ovule protein n=1 Tax=Solanum chacoense TaxID=4108 RepID=A0A0V0GWH5_SOLCH
MATKQDKKNLIPSLFIFIPHTKRPRRVNYINFPPRSAQITDISHLVFKFCIHLPCFQTSVTIV